MVFKIVEDPYKDSVQTWGEGNLYFRLKYLPTSREWYLRLDEIKFGQDNVLRQWTVIRGDFKSKTRAINKTLKIIADYQVSKSNISNLLNI